MKKTYLRRYKLVTCSYFRYYFDMKASLCLLLCSLTIFHLSNATLFSGNIRNDCEQGWVRYKSSKCFKAFHSSVGLTHDEGQDYCESQGSNLASVLSTEERDFLISYLLRESRGNPSALPDYWVGGRRLQTQITWFDLMPFSYTDWYQGWEPQNQPDKHCTAFATAQSRLAGDSNYGKLFLRSCGEKLTGIVCNKHLAPVSLSSYLFKYLSEKNKRM